MYNFSILISDTIASDLVGKVRVCNELLINNMEINDSINGKNISEMSGEEIEKARDILIENNKKIVLINCIRSISEIESYKLLFRKAYILRAENIKIGMWNLVSDELESLENLKKVCSIARSYGIGVILENDSKTILSTDKEITGIFKSVQNEILGLIFNPLEYVKEKKHPFFHEFYNSKLKNEVRFLRINDGLFVDGSSTLPGDGNAEIKEMTSILFARGFKGYFSFTPYMDGMDVRLYKEVIFRFKKMLKEL